MIFPTRSANPVWQKQLSIARNNLSPCYRTARSLVSQKSAFATPHPVFNNFLEELFKEKRMKYPAKLYLIFGLLLSLALVASACVAPAPGGAAAPASSGAAAGSAKKSGFVIGVSNTLVGNGWREQMICAIKAEAKTSGLVSKVV